MSIQHLKLATNSDFPHIKRMLLEFKEASPYKDFPTNENKIEQLIWDLLSRDKKDAIIILAGSPPVGMLIGTATDLPFADTRQAAETIWWVSPDARKSTFGLDLYKAFEYWATRVGARVIHSAAPADVPLDKWYVKRGYSKLETVYLKEVRP